MTQTYSSTEGYVDSVLKVARVDLARAVPGVPGGGGYPGLSEVEQAESIVIQLWDADLDDKGYKALAYWWEEVCELLPEKCLLITDYDEPTFQLHEWLQEVNKARKSGAVANTLMDNDLTISLCTTYQHWIRSYDSVIIDERFPTMGDEYAISRTGVLMRRLDWPKGLLRARTDNYSGFPRL